MQIVRYRAALGGALILALALSACGDSKDAPVAEPPSPSAALVTPTAAPPTPTPEASPTPRPPTRAEITRAVRVVIEEKGADASVDFVEFDVDLDSETRDLIEEIFDRQLEASGVSAGGDDEEPDVMYTYMNGVNTLYAGESEQAISAFDLVIRVHPEMPRAYFYRSVAHYRSELYDKAMEDILRSIELDPDAAPSHLQRGLILHDLGEEDAALAAFDRAIAMAPWLADAYRNRGAALINAGNAERGMVDLARALQMYQLLREEERVEETRALIEGPPTPPVDLFRQTDILPDLP